MDVYREELPLQHGIPHDLPELCVRYDCRDVVLMNRATRGLSGAQRIHGIGMNLLDPNNQFPVDQHYDAIRCNGGS